MNSENAFRWAFEVAAVYGIYQLARIAAAAEAIVKQMKAFRRGDITSDVR